MSKVRITKKVGCSQGEGRHQSLRSGAATSAWYNLCINSEGIKRNRSIGMGTLHDFFKLVEQFLFLPFLFFEEKVISLLPLLDLLQICFLFSFGRRLKRLIVDLYLKLYGLMLSKRGLFLLCFCILWPWESFALFF